MEEYESYTESSESEASNEEDEEEEQPTTTSDVIIEFGSSTLPPPLSMESKKNDHASRAKTQRENSRERLTLDFGHFPFSLTKFLGTIN